MHPPFIHTDHRIGTHYPNPKPHVRRTRPTRLDLIPVAQGWPPLPLLDPSHLAKEAVSKDPQIFLVPSPRRAWRDILGRFLIRLGQRMIAANGPG